MTSKLWSRIQQKKGYPTNTLICLMKADKETLAHHEEIELELVFVARVIC